MSNDSGNKEKWHYCGRRVNAAADVSEVWLAADGSAKWFAAKACKAYPRRPVVGGAYMVPVTHGEDGNVTVRFGSIEHVAEDKHPDAETWEGLDGTAYAHSQRVAAEKRAGRERSFDATCDRLRRIYRETPAATRTAMLALIIGRITR